MTAEQLARSFAEQAIAKGKAKGGQPWFTTYVSEKQAAYLINLMDRQKVGGVLGTFHGGQGGSTLTFQCQQGCDSGNFDFQIDRSPAKYGGHRFTFRHPEVLVKGTKDWDD